MSARGIGDLREKSDLKKQMAVVKMFHLFGGELGDVNKGIHDMLIIFTLGRDGGGVDGGDGSIDEGKKLTG